MPDFTMPGPDDVIIPRDETSSRSSDFDLDGDTRTIDSSITQYRIENGRRYHAYRDGAYWAPNDERQNENLDISHHMSLLLLNGKLYLAPLSKGIERALDLGTGTGIWAIDFADEFPDTTVLGTDLSPIQPEFLPPNCRFEIDDVSDDWLYPPNYFDYIHIRSLFGSIEDWPQLYSRAFKHIKPGGYIEQFEISVQIKSDDYTVLPGSPLSQFAELYTDVTNITGKSFRITDTMKRDIEAAGFINVQEEIFKAPLGSWPADPKLRELGMWVLLTFDTGLEGYALALLTRVMGWNSNEAHVLLAQVRSAAKDKRIHSYYEISVVYGQKPLAK